MAGEFSVEDYKKAVGSFVTGITVVTAASDEGPVGFTCQSFTSLSLDPPMTTGRSRQCFFNYAAKRKAKERSGVPKLDKPAKVSAKIGEGLIVFAGLPNGNNSTDRY